MFISEWRLLCCYCCWCCCCCCHPWWTLDSSMFELPHNLNTNNSPGWFQAFHIPRLGLLSYPVKQLPDSDVCGVQEVTLRLLSFYWVSHSNKLNLCIIMILYIIIILEIVCNQFSPEKSLTNKKNVWRENRRIILDHL